jgi:hypothetical protein
MICVACGLAAFLGDITKKDLLGMPEMDVDLKGRICNLCNCGVDIVGVQLIEQVRYLRLYNFCFITYSSAFYFQYI